MTIYTIATARGAKAMALSAIGAMIMVFAVACQDSPPSPTPSESAAEAQAMTAMADEGNPGISDDRVLFGQSAAFSGPAQALGHGMRLGIEAAFHEQNQAGGVHGRMLELTTLDDQYESRTWLMATR